MSVPVQLDGLVERIEEYGREAYLVTTNEDLSPHVVSVVVELDGDRLTVGAGRSTRANAARLTTVTLLWPATPAQAYSLLVDATPPEAPGDDDAERLVLTPRSAILHRVAGRDGEGPTCLPVDQPTGPA